MIEENKLKLPVLTQQDYTLLEELSNACAVSGNEKAVRRIVRREVEGIADSIEVDALGNMIAIKKSACKNPVRVLISAHMDEVGFMIVEEDKPGIFRFECVGGIDPRALAGKAVLVGPQHIPGVIGACPVHLTSREDRKKTIKKEDLRIDIGGEDKRITPGCPAYFATTFTQNEESICGKALDDRLGVCTLIRLLRDVPEQVELTAVFTVQEEVGLRGASVAAWNRHPDMAIIMDSTPANDLPSWDGEESTIYKSKLGQGPAIYTMDGRTMNDPRLISYLLRLAEAYRIPCQLRQPAGGGTDAGEIHKTQCGCPAISVSIPGRYAHTAASIARKSDWQAHLQLIYAALCNADHSLFEQPR